MSRCLDAAAIHKRGRELSGGPMPATVLPEVGFEAIPQSSCSSRKARQRSVGFHDHALATFEPPPPPWKTAEIRSLLRWQAGPGRRQRTGRLPSMNSPGLFVPTYGQPTKSSSSSSRVLPSRISTSAGIAKRPLMPALVFNGRVEYVQVQ